MRSVESEMLEYINKGTSGTCGNTTVKQWPDGSFSVFLFGNEIAYGEFGKVKVVNLRGWNTNTTRSRINALPGFSICTKKGKVFLNGQEIGLYGGYDINGDKIK